MNTIPLHVHIPQVLQEEFTKQHGALVKAGVEKSPEGRRNR